MLRLRLTRPPIHASRRARKVGQRVPYGVVTFSLAIPPESARNFKRARMYGHRRPR